MKVKPLLPQQPVTVDGRLPSRDLLEVIQGLTSQVTALQAKLSAIAAVTAPSGGATVDAQSRTAIAAIIAAAT